ncbi:MAG: CRISPR system precrRNA processing endoribonuclease RAMP protein Cas6 [Anaerolineales bacterium]
MSDDDLTFPLTCVRLRFDCEAITIINLGGLNAGSNLRGALLNVMNRAVCALSAFTPQERLKIDPQHVDTCPVCWLLLHEKQPGQVRRGYALVPPLDSATLLPSGERFSFCITLFGETQRYLAYFVLAVSEMGRIGVGSGRGRFRLRSVTAELPNQSDWVVLKDSDHVIRPPEQPVTHRDLRRKADIDLDVSSPEILTFRFYFRTPLRLIVNKHLLQVTPSFVTLFSHLLKRLDELAFSFAGGYQRSFESRNHLRCLAQAVQMGKHHTHWVEVASGSQRLGRKTWISGLLGWADYSAPAEVWHELLPWLLWGELAQVGKDVVKGDGVFKFVLL